MVDQDAKSSLALAELGLEAPLRQLAHPSVDEWKVRRMWEGIQRRRAARPFRDKARWRIVLVSALAAFGLSLAVFSLLAADGLFEHRALDAAASAAGPLLTREARSFEGLEAPHHPASPAAADDAARPMPARVDFADGSSIEAEAGTRVDALGSTAEEFAVRVRRGRAQFRVTPGGPRRWRIEAGAASVEVLGTVLWVERDDAETRVRVETGRVLVRSPELPGGARNLSAGQSLRLSGGQEHSGEGGPDQTFAPSDRAAAASPPSPIAAPPAEPPAALPAPAGEAASPASAALEHPKTTPRDAALARHRPTPAAELWEAVDEARRRGQSLRAAELLRRLLRDHPADSQVALAAFTLGVIQLERLAQPAEAALSFQRALELGIGAALREDAYLRWAEALARAGTGARIDAVLAEYVRRYPHGRQRAAIERLRRRADTEPVRSPQRGDSKPGQRANQSRSPEANQQPSGVEP
jgi:hypothetical protein